MIGLVLFTSISIGSLVAYTFTIEINHFYDSLNPELQLVFDRQLERAFDSEDYPTNLDNQPALLLPIVLPALLALAMAVWLSRRIARPLEAVSQAASEVAAGRLEARVQLTHRQLKSGDEASGLARNFNGMAESLEALERERRDSSAAIAHELRTPLTVLRARLQAGVDGVLPLDEAAARILLEQTELLSRLVDDLKTLSLADTDQLRLNLAPLELCAFVQEQVDGFGGRAAQRNIRLECFCAEQTLFMQADRQRMAQVLFNLLENAIRYTPNGGTVTVRLERKPTWMRLSVEDSGPGIPSDALEQVFERFYRTDASRSRHSGGSGLGLAIVRSIVALHGGRVWAENRPEGGARLVIQL
jgi:two-component system, OmpR family, sensor histidine kinase BaeS